mgnify:CR=1 FL=1
MVEMYQFIRLLFQVALEAFGKRFDLELNRNLNLVPDQRKLNVFFADRGKEDIHYERGDNEVERAVTPPEAAAADPNSRPPYVTCSAGAPSKSLAFQCCGNVPQSHGVRDVGAPS